MPDMQFVLGSVHAYLSNWAVFVVAIRLVMCMDISLIRSNIEPMEVRDVAPVDCKETRLHELVPGN